MPTHTLSRSTRTVELDQVLQINDALRVVNDLMEEPVTAALLGLGGAAVEPWVLDRAAAVVLAAGDRRRECPHLPAAAALSRVLAAGAPAAPYLYGIFAEIGSGRRELPVVLHTGQLRAISAALHLRHHLWGV